MSPLLLLALHTLVNVLLTPLNSSKLFAYYAPHIYAAHFFYVLPFAKHSLIDYALSTHVTQSHSHRVYGLAYYFAIQVHCYDNIIDSRQATLILSMPECAKLV